MTRLWLIAPLLLAACVHAPRTQSLFVSGKAHECAGTLFDKPAAGRTLHLVVGRTVVARDVVGPDGSFVLHPKDDYDVSGPAFVEVDGSHVPLSNDFASWLQEHLHHELALCVPPVGAKPGTAAYDLSTSSPGGDAPSPASGAPPKIQLPRGAY